MKSQIRKFRSILAALFIVTSIAVTLPSPAQASCISMNDLATQPAGNGFWETCGGDDLSYRIPINGSVIFGGVTYTNIYATTNSVITFGREDGNFYSFPTTPSISLDAYDWVEDGFYGYYGESYNIGGAGGLPRSDEFFNITVSGDTFRVDIAARPYGTYQDSQFANSPDGTPARMTLTFVRRADGTLLIRSFSSTANNANLRNGCVLTDGAAAITLAECGIMEVASIEALTEKPIDVLVALTPVTLTKTTDGLKCSSADLRYLVQGAHSEAAKIDSQYFVLKADGKEIARANTLGTSATFASSLLPASGTITCSQVANQGSAQVVVETALSSTRDALADVRKADIAVAQKAYQAAVDAANAKKSMMLVKHQSDSSIDYTVVTAQWKKELQDAAAVRDAAIAAAYTKEQKSIQSSGAALVLGK